jgi:hypothetical protein
MRSVPLKQYALAEKVVGDHARTYAHGTSVEAFVGLNRDAVRTKVIERVDERR